MSAKKRSVRDLQREHNDDDAAKPAASKQPEKRLKRYRSSCPAPIQMRIERAVTQRLYLVDHQVTDDDDAPRGTFTVLGSTGNVYTVVISHLAECNCPDFGRRQGLCKHVMFVLLKVVRLPPDSPLVYQAAWITSELQEILRDRLCQRQVGGGVLANARVRQTYAQLQKGDGSAKPDHDDKNQGDDQRRQPIQGDCPICFDALQSNETLTFCRAVCGANFHAACLQQWKKQSRDQTCPNCRAPWESDDDDKASDGYTNLGRLQGQSSRRDTSTYYRRRRYRYSHDEADEDNH